MSKAVEALTALRNMTADDLDDHLRRQRRRLFEVRFQQATGQVENHRQIREIRREIARTMTVQIELARGHAIAPPEIETEDEEARPRRRLGRRARTEDAETGEAAPEAAQQSEAADATEVVDEAVPASSGTDEAAADDVDEEGE